MTDLKAIVARDADEDLDMRCPCDAASFWAGDICVVCGHERAIHGADLSRCAVRSPRLLSAAAADRRALLVLLRETRDALDAIYNLAEASAYHRNYRAAVVDIHVRARDMGMRLKPLAALDAEVPA